MIFPILASVAMARKRCPVRTPLLPNCEIQPWLIDADIDAEKHQSGFSDMLAAFPPPAQATAPRRSWRDSFRQQVPWPLPLNTNTRGFDGSQENATPSPEQATFNKKRGRRCCGLPLWGFIIVAIVAVILIAAAIIIPIELFVVRRQGDDGQAALQQCKSQLACRNGGRNVVNDGFCSCYMYQRLHRLRLQRVGVYRLRIDGAGRH